MTGTAQYSLRFHVRIFCLLGGVLLAVGAVAPWGGPSAAGDGSGGQGSAAYLAGLDALLDGKCADAAVAFGKAVDADEDNVEYRSAHGVALALAEQFAPAIKELERSLRMRDDWETKMWLGTAYRLGGDPGKAANYIVNGPPGVALPVKTDVDYRQLLMSMSQSYWAAEHGAHPYDYKSGKALTSKDIAAVDFVKAGAMFAKRRRAATPAELGGQLLDRVKAKMQGKQFATALKDLESLLAASPEDDALLVLRADAELATGDYVSSRKDYTRVLSDQPALAAGYLGRAQAAAGLADADRARSDLVMAEKLGTTGMDVARQQVEQRLVQSKAGKEDAEAVAAILEQATRAGQDAAGLAETSLRLAQAVNAHRLRYDESYQDHLRVLDEALQADPKNAARSADFADFLFSEANVPFEQVEPGTWRVYYRYTSQSVIPTGVAGQMLVALPPQRAGREVDRAERMADAALTLEGGQLKALRVKGAILNWREKYREARPVVEKALAIKGDDPELLCVMAQTLEGMARDNMAEAFGLRRIKTIEGPHAVDGTYTITTISPSAADLAKAAALEKEAGEFRRMAADDMAKAVQLTAGTAQGFCYQGQIELAAGHGKEAKDAFAQAVKLDPKSRDAWQRLVGVLHDVGPEDEYVQAQSASLNLVQTTAAPWLVYARQNIQKTKYRAARQALANAHLLDAADSRIEAYLAVIEAENDKGEEAMVHYRQSIALEEARSRLHGRSLGGSGALALTVDDIGLTLVLRQRAAALTFLAGQADAASGLFAANMAFLSSLSSEQQATIVPQANIPSGNAEPAAAPFSESYGSLKIRAQAGLDYTAWSRRYNDPRSIALAAQTYDRLAVKFQMTDAKAEVVQAVINLGLAELQVSKGNFAEAKELLRNEGATPQALWQEMRKVDAQANDTGRR